MKQKQPFQAEQKKGSIPIEELGEKLAQKLDEMTSEERFQTLVSAGICLPDGTLHPTYKDLPLVLGR